MGRAISKLRETGTTPINYIIFHICFVREAHIEPKCKLALREQWNVLHNY